MSNQELLDNLEGTEIAVIGMAGRFPGADNVEKFWENLRDGVETIVTYTDDELREAGVSEKILQNPNYVKSGAPLDNMEMFDANFFGFSPRDAAIMDPQHRHFIEISWEALEQAGYDPSRYNGSIGVFGGSGHNIYMPYNLLTNPALMESVGFFLIRHTSNDKDFLVTRVSYLFDLKGPSVNVQTACSTSLVAIHLGVQSLLNRETDIVLAGGVTFELPHRQGYMYEEGEILSPDGHCRAFDAESKGTRFGSGAGVVVLKRLDEAIEDGDTIHAVIKGSAINNDGSNKVNYLAPSVDGQAAAINEALMLANVEPETVTYIETHGTGTSIGDPIEVAALTMAYGADTEEKQFCGIGSVKPNIGHLDTAAGVAGFIKAVEALKHKQIPASLNYSAPNPSIDFENSPFFVNAELRDWETDGFPRRAGISSLGVGGTNAHIIIEEAPEVEASSESREKQLLTLSAKTSSALDTMTANLAQFLRKNPDLNLADVAFTMQNGRQRMNHRRVVAVDSVDDAIEVLENSASKRILSTESDVEAPAVVFMFTGQGAQYANMGRDLYETEPVFQDTVDECAEILEPILGFDLRDVLYPAEDGVEEAGKRLADTAVTQPALFTIEYATAQLWMSWGLEPKAMIGHSIGEYTAACVAGVFSLEDALALVSKRGALMASLPAGTMLVVQDDEAKVRPYLNDKVSMATINAPGLCVVAGEIEAVDALQETLQAANMMYRRLHTSHAFHSHMMDPILAPFAEEVARKARNAPEIPYVSNVSGTWITPEQATDPQYYASHIRSAVRFADGLKEILARDEKQILLEVGPGKTLTTFAKQNPALGAGHTPISSIRHPKEQVSDLTFVLEALGQVWMAGGDIIWEDFYADEFRHRIPLPTYPFEQKRFWIEPGKQQFDSSVTDIDMSKKEDVRDWFYQPVWKQSVNAIEVNEADDSVWVLFADDLGLSDALAQRLNGRSLFTVSMGEQFGQDGDSFVLNPNTPTDYDKLVGALPKERPVKMIYGWALNANGASFSLDDVPAAQTVNFNSLLFLAQAIGSSGDADPVELIVISNNAQQVAGEAILHPEQALLAGPVRVIPNEFSHVSSRLIDVAVPQQGSWQEKKFYDQLFAEVRGPVADTAVAYRGLTRWIQDYEASPIATTEATPELLQKEGVYLVTGGLGGLGLLVARHLAETVQPKLVLLSRSEMPAKAEWDNWLAGHSPHDKTSKRIKQVRSLEALGAEVLVVAADVAHLAQMETAVSQAKATFGKINGVIHAAGALDDGLIQMKTGESSEKVLAAKVQGSLVLDAVLKDENLDFMVLFSSVSAISGIAGQIDYTSANAFLDAFARYKTAQDGTYTVAINWGAWQDVGMTADLVREMGLVDPEGVPVAYPFIDKWMDAAEEDLFATQFSPDTHWLLDEHRLKEGNAILPGTGYLELARAALNSKPSQNGVAHKAIELKEVFFMAPFMVPNGETKELKISLSKESTASFAVKSRVSEEADLWQDHVRGSIGWVSTNGTQQVNKDEILARCTARQEEYDLYEHEQLLWGPRWDNLRQMNYGENEALARIQLPDAFMTDLEQFQLHPAMLDLATAGAQDLITGFDASTTFYVPFSYNRLRMYGSLTQEVFSHIRYRAGGDADTAVFDITIFDNAGTVLVEIDGFMMRRFVEAPSAGGSAKDNQAPTLPTAPVNPLLETIQRGISPAEGLLALDTVLAQMVAPQVVVVSQDLQGLIQQAKQGDSSAQDDGAGAGLAFDRPDLSTPFVAPETELQGKIAAIWQEMLGITEVGINDDFFELGGHSLLLTQVVTRVRKLTTADVSLFSLFEATTVTELAVEIEKAQEDEDDDAGPAPVLGRVSRDKYRTKRKALKIKK